MEITTKSQTTSMCGYYIKTCYIDKYYINKCYIYIYIYVWMDGWMHVYIYIDLKDSKGMDYAESIFRWSMMNYA